jgi:hypothetical protein
MTYTNMKMEKVGQSFKTVQFYNVLFINQFPPPLQILREKVG